jgi:hypothetical protein
MASTHDKLKVMTTEEILQRNIYDLQEQLNEAHKKIALLHEELEQSPFNIWDTGRIL